MKFTQRLSLFGKVIFFKFQVIDEPHTYTAGITSRCKDGQHILFLDWDGVDESVVRNDIRYIIKNFRLGDCYLFKTDNGFHLICLDKMPFGEVVNIQGHTCCDYAFKSALQTFGDRSWVLRVVKKGDSPKPVFLEVIRGMGYREKSLAHAMFLSKYYGVNVDSLLVPHQFDDESELDLLEYKTAKCKKGVR